jgi:cytochrome c oxidase subunit 2
MARRGGGQWRARLRLLLAALVAALATLAFGLPALAAVNVSPFDPAGPNAARINDLYTVIFWMAVVVTIVVGGLIVFAALRFRRRDEQEPSQFHSHTALEITWTAVPFAILAVIFVLTAQNMGFINTGPREGMTIKIIASQFSWTFVYPDPRVTSTAPGTDGMVVPVGEDIRLEIVSRDVNHSWWVPRLAGKTDAIPGQTNHAWFRADAPGTYDGQCTEFCGIGHAIMATKVVAKPRAEYDQWYAGKLRAATASPSPAATRTPSPSPSR